MPCSDRTLGSGPVVVISKALDAVQAHGQTVESRTPIGRSRRLTSILEVVQSVVKDLHWAGKVQEIELGVQDRKDVNGFIRHGGGLVCSHLDGWGREGLCVQTGSVINDVVNGINDRSKGLPSKGIDSIGEPGEAEKQWCVSEMGM